MRLSSVLRRIFVEFFVFYHKKGRITRKFDEKREGKGRFAYGALSHAKISEKSCKNRQKTFDFFFKLW